MFHVRLIYAIIYLLLARLLFLTVGRSVTAAVRVEGGPDFFQNPAHRLLVVFHRWQRRSQYSSQIVKSQKSTSTSNTSGVTAAVRSHRR